MKHSVPRICIACHAKKLGEPVTARDCLGFASCETCTQLTEPPKDYDNDKPRGSGAGVERMADGLT